MRSKSLAISNITFFRYLQEYQPLGTAGGLYHFRDQIVTANTKAIVVIHADIFCVIPLTKMMEMFCAKNENNPGSHIVLGTQVHQVNLFCNVINLD